MVVAAGYKYAEPFEANHYMLDLIAKTRSVGGLGVFYWEPECYNWQNYGMGAWDPATEEPTVALDAFLGKEATDIIAASTVSGYSLNIYPNPFNPSTVISYRLSTNSFVNLKVYDVLGRLVRTLVDANQPKGKYEIKFDASSLSSGVYFCRIMAGSYAATRKILLQK